MEYEGSIGFVSRKMKKKNHVLGLFMAKKHDDQKNFRMSRIGAVAVAVAAPLNAKFVPRLQPRP
jgi:hypothetical protein